jgi:predicted enzyme related to lactoylglutathione lyase
MNPVNWFEIPAKDLARAKSFYGHVFSVELQHMEMGPAAMEMFPADQGAPGAGGALISTEGYTPSHAGTVVYFSVEDIEGTCARANANGGKTLVPKMSIGEFGFIGQIEDSEGNRIGLHSMK